MSEKDLIIKIKNLLLDYTSETNQLINGILVNSKVNEVQSYLPPEIKKDEDILVSWAKMNTSIKGDIVKEFSYEIKIISEELEGGNK